MLRNVEDLNIGLSVIDVLLIGYIIKHRQSTHPERLPGFSFRKSASLITLVFVLLFFIFRISRLLLDITLYLKRLGFSILQPNKFKF
ncbi:hypothetical protein BY458DRAFT_200 [Sporodiniella umbellata]|nr:hypothetical protein BY458DRAFT_200 [Sporodiniella umbellata]